MTPSASAKTPDRIPSATVNSCEPLFDVHMLSHGIAVVAAAVIVAAIVVVSIVGPFMRHGVAVIIGVVAEIVIVGSHWLERPLKNAERGRSIKYTI